MELLRIILGGLFVTAVVWAAGRLVARRTPLPASVRFPTGAVCVSLAVFLLLQLHAGYLGVFLTLGGATIIAGTLSRPAATEPLPPIPQPWRTFYWLVFGGFTAWYFVFALAPEVQADAVGYHLGLVSEYVRDRGMPPRVSFFDLLPQGIEMLFVPAFAIGRHSAAKLVHFAFFLILLPLLRRTGAVVGLTEPAPALGALLFFLSPVAAVDGTAAYADLALTCASTAVFYLLLRWRKEQTDGLLIAAGLNAGFCYAIKPTLGFLPLAGLVFILWRSRSGRLAALFTGTAALSMLPWIGRSFVLTGNPFAPFLNRWFPHDGIPASTDEGLARFFGMFSPDFQWKTVYLDYTIWGGHQGMLGIAFLLSPLALFALRTRSGRWLLGYSFILLLTFPTNAGTRFLMPAAGPLSLAFASVLPAPVSMALVVLQGAGSVRPVLNQYNLRHDWQLPPVPLRAAFRLESEDDYLTRNFFDYRTSRMVKANTPPGARIYAMGPFAWAYLEREPLVFWHSSRAQEIWTNLIFIQVSGSKPAATATWSWPGRDFRAVRVRAFPEVRIPEARGLPGEFRRLPWTAWNAAAPFLMNLPPGTTGFEAEVWPHDVSQLKLEVQQADGSWTTPPAPPETKNTPATFPRDLMADLLAAGYGYVLVPIAHDAFEAIGRDMAARPNLWGVKPVGQSGDSVLFRISPL